MQSKYAGGRQSSMLAAKQMEQQTDNMFAQMKSQKSFGDPVLATSGRKTAFASKNLIGKLGASSGQQITKGDYEVV